MKISRILAQAALTLLPVVAMAAESRPLSYLDGDWNADGVPDRAYLIAFDDTGAVDLAVYLGESNTGELRLAAHRENVGSLNGLSSNIGYERWTVPVLRAGGAGDSFEMFNRNDTIQETKTFTMNWRNGAFVVGTFRSESVGLMVCNVDYMAKRATFIPVGPDAETQMTVTIAPVKIADWKLHMDYLPEFCFGR